jgi:hypothetical protein
LPLTAGKVHFIRAVSQERQIMLLNQHWEVSAAKPGQGVWATLQFPFREPGYVSMMQLRMPSAEPAWPSILFPSRHRCSHSVQSSNDMAGVPSSHGLQPPWDG